ncbi:MAG: DUF4416 family protein [Fibrobacterales bacterium]
MGQYRKPKPVKLIIGILARSEEHIKNAIPHLITQYGPLDVSLKAFPFSWTNYYEEEIGENPVRAFISFSKLIERESIVDIKRFTNNLELSLFNDSTRHVNLDPGYMTLGQYFLPTTKDQRHRAYIRDGIFIEPTLYFQNGEWHHFDWTYYDYRSKEYLDYFQEVRKSLRINLKEN